MISVLLAKKIAQLFLIMFIGYFAVKLKVLNSDDSVGLSKLCLYVIVPCVILVSFQVEFTPEVRGGLILSMLAGAVIMSILIFTGYLSKKIFNLNPMEQASVVY